MKIKIQTLFFVTAICLPALLKAQINRAAYEYYQITTYHYTDTVQQSLLHNYLEKAYLPALHRQQIKSIGVFTPIANDTATNKKLIIIFPLTSLQRATELPAILEKDIAYNTSAKDYLNAVYTAPPYKRMEIWLLKAFPLAPFIKMPRLTSPRAAHVYELRSYESHTEKIFQNKVKMFNAGGEIALFKKLGFNAIFYGSVISGPSMPNLVYMTSFENMDDRNQHWKKFSDAPEWKKLSGLAEYQHNVSKNEQTLMRAAPYSDY